MANRNLVEMALTADQLNEKDQAILDLLYEGRVTPAFARAELLDRWDDDETITRQYINQRLTRLAEHNHVRNLQEKGLYELVIDPREESPTALAERVLKRLSRHLSQPITVGEVIYEDGDAHALSAAESEEVSSDE